MVKRKALIIGPLPYIGHQHTIGGTTVLMQNFIDFLQGNDFPYELIISNSKKENITSHFISFFYIVAGLMTKNYKSIMLNSSFRSLFYIAPIILIFSFCTGKKFYLRIFGGNLIEVFNSSNFLKKIILDTILKYCDVCFVETKAILEYLDNKYKNRQHFHWFPNVRRKVEREQKKLGTFSKKFVFIGQIRKSKGVMEIVEVFKNLDSSYTIDFYGPIFDEELRESIINSYKGVLPPEDVTKTLCKYDVLLLPTFHTGEGYPGIVIECFAAGIPIIATNWKSIPELIQNGYNGLLVPVKDTESLTYAITSITNANYSTFSKNSLESFELYSDENNNQRITDLIFGK